MYYGLEHGVPMVNGYSGFFPKSYMQLRNFVNDELPSAQILDRFASENIEHVVVARKYCSPDIMLGMSTGEFRLILVYEDPIGIDVYRLESRK